MPKSSAPNPYRIASPTVPKHQCADCGIKLTRPSHLARHQDSHLPAHQRRHLPCPLCNASFSRNDVLLRHLRITHKSEPASRRSARKSCQRCIEKKLKCNRGEPCQRCTKAGVFCDYAAAPGSGSESGRPGGSLYSPQPRLESSGNELSDAQDMGHEWTALVSPQATACSGDTEDANSKAAEGMVAPMDMGIDDCDTGPDTLGNDSLVGNAFPYQTLPQYAAESSVAQAAPETPYSNLNEAILFRPSGQPSTSFAMWGSEFSNINLDWLDFGTASSVDILDESPLASDGVALQMRHTQGHPNSAHGELIINSTDGRLQEAADTQQWPFGQTRDSVPQKYKLPPLHDVLHGAFAPGNLSDSSDALVRILSRAYLPKFEDIQDHATLAAMKTLERSLNAFLNEFNPILPIVHVPTWSMDDCPTVLLAAMASIGAIFADEPGAAAYSQLLSDICNQMITWLGGSDSTNYHDLAYLSASCLQQIYSLGSGNRQLYQNADRSRGMLMGSLRGMSLLGTQLILGQSRPSLPKTSPTADAFTLYNDWLRWKKEEQEIRVVWASFEYDCTLSTLTNRRGAVDLAELPTRLPCPEAVWEAPSAQAWNALRTHHSDRTMNASLPEALQKTLASGVVPEQNADLPPWGKRLCAQVIGRLLWDLKQLQIMSMSDFLGMKSLFAAQRQTKSALLHGLDKLADSMNTPSSIAELINYNITGLICHYNYLCTAEDVMDLVVFITRSSMEPRANRFQYPELDVGLAERRLESLFKADLAQTRSLAWHAAQIIGVANTYTVSAPCEILRIFMGYAFILAVAKYCPEICTPSSVNSSNSSKVPATNNNNPVQLDSSSTDDAHKRSIMEWTRYGGPASIATCKDFCTPVGMKCVSEHAQALLQRMRFWGLAEKLKRVLESFHSKG